MQVFRSIAGKVAAAVFAVLMLIFLWTSVDWSQIRGGSRSSVGKINGTTVPLRAYQQMVQNELQARQRQTGHSLSAEEVEEVRNAVWNELIQQQSLEREYRIRGIDVTADEIATAITDNPLPELMNRPEFQTDNKFDIEKYHRWLHSSGGAQVVPLLEAQYAEQIRQAKLLRVVTGDVYLSDPALWQRWKDANEKVTIDLVAISPNAVIPDSAVPVTDSELRSYYTQHQGDFKRPATAYLSYLEVLRTTNAADSATARQRALDLRKEIQAGAPFEEVAKRESADSASAQRGGELGEFGKGAMDPAFERAAFSLPIGVVSEPVLSAFGYHLIKVEKRTGGKVTARHILIPVEIAGQHRDELDARADTLESLGSEKLDPAALDTAARALGLKVGQTNPLEQGGRVRIGLQVVPDAGVWAFQAKVGETSRIVEVSYAYFLFRLDSLQAEGVPPFEKVKEAVATAVRSAGKKEAARAIGADLVKRIGEGSSLDQAATALKLPHRTFPPFVRTNPPLPSPRLAGAAFGIAEGKASGLIEGEDAFYVFEVVKREPADSVRFVKELDQYRSRQIGLARQERIQNYLAALRETAKVEDRRATLFRTEAQSEQAQKRS
ncbi:MAG TPA: peptidyl-prolyl cis-trans isomerase [Gemmatimonadales bacterium]